MQNRSILKVINRLGSHMPYDVYLRLQEQLRSAREELILVCEHRPVLTCGVQFKPESLRISPEQLQEKGIDVVRVGRGGDVTAHEPGQIVFYVHADLRARGIALSAFFQSILAAARSALARVWNIQAEMNPKAPGLYVDGRKIASIGVQFKSFFTSHGIAVNVRNDLQTFSWIHPCGYPDLPMTTVEREGGSAARAGLFVDTLTAELMRSLEDSSGSGSENTLT